MSITFTLTGNTSTLEADYFPPIVLNSRKSYSLGLVTFQSYNSIPNIDESCNRLDFANNQTIIIPTGSYTIEDINAYLQKNMTNITISSENTDSAKKTFEGPPIIIRANNNTLKSEIWCRWDFDFLDDNSIGPLLGFQEGDFRKGGEWHESLDPIKISKVNSIKVECSITYGAFTNGTQAHTIHEFSPDVPPGYKISESPRSIIYMPVSVRVIDNITLNIVDQNGALVNFRGEEITVRLHLKED